MIYLFIVLALVGMTHIIVDSKFLLPLRNYIEKKHIWFFGHDLYEMITCHQCAGFWVGFLGWGFIGIYLPYPEVSEPVILTIFKFLITSILSGCLISLFSMFSRSLLDWLQLNISIPEGPFTNDAEEETE